jgi:hypothetical protein
MYSGCRCTYQAFSLSHCPPGEHTAQAVSVQVAVVGQLLSPPHCCHKAEAWQEHSSSQL